MPTANTRLNNTIIFKEKPTNAMLANAISIESGMATATKTLFRHPMKTKRTATTRMNPVNTLFSSSVIIMAT